MIIENKLQNLTDHLYAAITESANEWYLTLHSTYRPSASKNEFLHVKYYKNNLLEGISIKYFDQTKIDELHNEILNLTSNYT